jgi:transketolase
MTNTDIDIRDAYFDSVYEAGLKNKEIVVVTNDMDVFSLRKFKQEFPKRFINIGVAEQNMVNVAAGLASEGKKVIVYGISSFVTSRCYEQLKLNVCGMNLPVILVGIGSGLSFSYDGPTHHGTQDIAIMRTLPEITILNPGDIAGAVASAEISLSLSSPSYVRIDKGIFPKLHMATEDLSKGFGVIRPLKEMNIISTGYMTAKAVQLVDELHEMGIEVGLVDLIKLKPIPREVVIEVLQTSRKIVTLEENTLTGGLGSAISELISDFNLRVQLLRSALPDKNMFSYGSRDWLLESEGLSHDKLYTIISSFYSNENWV